LEQHGVRFRIIDEESRTAAHSYACALHPASLCILERVGLTGEIIELLSSFEFSEESIHLERPHDSEGILRRLWLANGRGA
jgi:2-polyprenyl-6-methoxyphenol hydroxylase-like FAD-dependent oxidoreductase